MADYGMYNQQQVITTFKSKLLAEYMELYNASLAYHNDILETGGTNVSIQHNYNSRLGIMWRALSIFMKGLGNSELEAEFMKYESFAHDETKLVEDRTAMRNMEIAIMRALQNQKITEVI